MTGERGATLAVEEIEKSPSSYVDPNGFVFHHQGAIYRAVRSHVADFYRGLFDDGSIERLVAEHHLVPSALADLTLAQPEIGFVVRHEKIEPESYCVEWCTPMLRDAAAATLDLLTALLDRNATLQDAYPWNVLFRGAEPVFIDFTSIVQIDGPLIWPAYEQFQSFFMRPLALGAAGKGDAARALLMNNIAGISRGAFLRHAGFRYKLAHPFATLGNQVDSLIQRNSGLKTRLRQAAARPGLGADNRTRAAFYRGLRQRIASVATEAAGDPWATYYQEIDPSVDRQAKLRTVGDLVERLHPQSVLDAGCNTGVFSILAAERGARVVALDSSEACVSRLYAESRSRRLRVTPLIADLLCPTPAFGFLGTQYRPMVERVRSEMVLCLGLMHHLHIAGRQPFNRIAALMDALADRHLIFEFVAVDDANNDLIGAGRRIDYDLAAVVAPLKRHFPDIEVFPSDRPTRKILLCSRRP